jgi:hypothetical protein
VSSSARLSGQPDLHAPANGIYTLETETVLVRVIVVLARAAASRDTSLFDVDCAGVSAT